MEPGVELLALRAFQLTSLKLDEALQHNFDAHVTSILDSLENPYLLRVRKDILTAFKGLIHLGSLLAFNATYGQRVVGLQYQTGKNGISKLRKSIHMIGTIILPWLWMRIYDRSLEEDWNTSNVSWKQSASAWLHHAEKAGKVLEFGNHLLFLMFGRYLSLMDRVCGLVLITTPEKEKKLQSSNSLNFLSRELLWNGLFEMATFLLPLLDFRFIIGRMIKKINSLRGVSENTDSSGTQNPNCAICGRNPWSAHLGKCGHLFCYYCAASQCQQGSLQCPICFADLVLNDLVRVSS
eukprot:m.335433 g.335433  ORF g.335433 m.335433 type:complete len:294 (-) comp17592_c0_seq1:1377-2258(-)